MTTYKEAGVDLSFSDSVKEKITKLVCSTFNNSVVTKGGEFGGVCRIPGSKELLVSSVDGVGTKLKVAFLADKHDTVGQDLINHCVNDIGVMGAKPAFFLDYFASGKIEQTTILEVITGLTNACKQHDISLIGGETAQMPGIYKNNEYDLAGMIIGFAEESALLPKNDIKQGDVVIGFRSTGLHTNGYSLARKIVFEQNNWTVETIQSELGCTWGEELLKVHKSYYDIIKSLIENKLTKGLAHITGGGIKGNLSRIIPPSLSAKIDTLSIPVLPVFEVLQETGQVPIMEMYDVFNMGVGLISISSSDSASTVLKNNINEAFIIGEITKQSSDELIHLSY